MLKLACKTMFTQQWLVVTGFSSSCKHGKHVEARS